MVVLALVPAGTRQIVRRRRLVQLHGTQPSAAAAWAELRDSALDSGAPWADSVSPRQAATTLAALIRATEAAEPLAQLTHAEEVDRYANRPGAAASSLAADLREVRRALRARRSRRQAVRAALLPPSTLSRFRRGGA